MTPRKTGRPRKQKGLRVPVQFRLPADVAKFIRSESRWRGVSQADLVAAWAVKARDGVPA